MGAFLINAHVPQAAARTNGFSSCSLSLWRTSFLLVSLQEICGVSFPGLPITASAWLLGLHTSPRAGSQERKSNQRVGITAGWYLHTFDVIFSVVLHPPGTTDAPCRTAPPLVWHSAGGWSSCCHCHEPPNSLQSPFCVH